ncbi:DUF423 domain-containing protein [Cellvibrio mixtus]|uniref:DUF423 domain-containing protein n=1 Tax=Cellvibrio mixtus TaxID=39650 RepID=UPI00058772EC|nr:DUF423 domain-containing protein [Cellvibrio mixtus]
MARIFIAIAAISGFFSVVIGAFAAHGLKKMLTPGMIDVVKTGVQYQMYHALALLIVACLLRYKPSTSGLKASGWAFILGSLMFSGSLYALALGGPRWLGPITPLGGLCFLVGWALLAIVGWRTKPES